MIVEQLQWKIRQKFELLATPAFVPIRGPTKNRKWCTSAEQTERGKAKDCIHNTHRKDYASMLDQRNKDDNYRETQLAIGWTAEKIKASVYWLLVFTHTPLRQRAEGDTQAIFMSWRGTRMKFLETDRSAPSSYTESHRSKSLTIWHRKIGRDKTDGNRGGRATTTSGILGHLGPGNLARDTIAKWFQFNSSSKQEADRPPKMAIFHDGEAQNTPYHNGTFPAWTHSQVHAHFLHAVFHVYLRGPRSTGGPANCDKKIECSHVVVVDHIVQLHSHICGVALHNLSSPSRRKHPRRRADEHFRLPAHCPIWTLPLEKPVWRYCWTSPLDICKRSTWTH